MESDARRALRLDLPSDIVRASNESTKKAIGILNATESASAEHSFDAHTLDSLCRRREFTTAALRLLPRVA